MPSYQDADVTFKLAIQMRTHVLYAGGSTVTLNPSCSVHMLDRNVISDIAHSGASSEIQRLWLGFLDRPGVRLTSVFADGEGNKHSAPSFDEFVDNLGDSAAKLSAFFKDAAIASFSPQDARRVHDMLVAVKMQMPSEIAFYMEAAEVVKAMLPTGSERPSEDKLIEIARRHGVSTHSFVFVAFLASLYRKDQCDAYDLLFKKKKSKLTPAQRGYNAVADCHYLEMLAIALKHFPDAGLVTGDAAMAGFWKGFEVSGEGEALRVGVRPLMLRALGVSGAKAALARCSASAAD